MGTCVRLCLLALCAPLLSAALRCAAGAGGASAPRAGVDAPASAPKRAVVTLVAGPEWLPGVLTLGCSLREFAERNGVDMIALCYNVSGSLSRIEEAGWRCRSPDIIPNPKRRQPWKWDFTLKVVPFGLTQYDRVVVMDSDMVVLDPQGLSPLFQMPVPEGNILAVRDCGANLMTRWTREEASIMVQGGLFVLRPSRNTYSALLAAVGKVRSLDGGAQGFISRVFSGNVTWLPARFNYIRASACVNLIDRQSGYYRFDNDTAINLSRTVGHARTEARARADVRAGNVTVAHFHFLPKPWNCDPRRPSACGIGWATGSSRVDVLYESWRQINHRCRETPVR